ncbi:unnamed protein product, partial [Scytosiphon promiscuus]
EGEWVSLYAGKMVQAFDHRAASIIINPNNQHRPAQQLPTTNEQHQDPNWLPNSQYWVNSDEILIPNNNFLISFKDVTASTNVRSMIASLIPASAVGNTLPIIISDNEESLLSAHAASLIVANLNSICIDFISRKKIQGHHLNWCIVEQLPVIPLNYFDGVLYSQKTAGEMVAEIVLELTYTAHDMAPFARDMGYVDDKGQVKPPFIWDDERRLQLRAKLDAVFFHLYGVTDRDD